MTQFDIAVIRYFKMNGKDFGGIMCYVVENTLFNESVIGWFTALKNAKGAARRYHRAVIAKLVGPYMYEGRYVYKLRCYGKKFKYV